jgi:hypothetical protein
VFAQGEMTMRHRTFIGCVILMGLCSTAALAQNTLGELLDAGGKKLSKDEVKSALSGAHVSGLSTIGGTVDYDFKADGSYSGSGQGSRGLLWGLVGTWTVEDSGQLCTEYRLAGRSGAGGKETYCHFYFIVSDQHYLSESESDRNARILKRTVKK